MRSVDIGSLAGALSNAIMTYLLGITDAPPFYRSWIELKADPAGVSSGVARPSDVGQEMAAIHSLNPERLLSGISRVNQETASVFGRGALEAKEARQAKKRPQFPAGPSM